MYVHGLQNSIYYPVSTDLSLTPPSPTTFPSLRLVGHIPTLFPHTPSLCYDPDTIATLHAADSHTVAGYLLDTVRTSLAVLSMLLHLHSSDYCSSGQAIPVHWGLQMFQLTLKLHYSLIYQVVTKNVKWWNDDRLVFEGQDSLVNVSVMHRKRENN